MPDASASLRALALAVREHLLGGGAATLPGLGTLARMHVPARVHTHPDGRKALLPPGETVGLAASSGDSAALAALVVRHLGTLQADPGAALRAALDQLEARLAATGEARLDGVGTFVRTSGGVRFAAVPSLLGDVNRPFSAMPPVGTPPPPEEPAPPMETAGPPPEESIQTGEPHDAPSTPVETVPDALAPPATSVVAGVPVWTVGDASPEPTSVAPDDVALDETALGHVAPDDVAGGEPADDSRAPRRPDDPGWSPAITPPVDALGVFDDIEDADFSLVADAPPADPHEAVAPPASPRETLLDDEASVDADVAAHAVPAGGGPHVTPRAGVFEQSTPVQEPVGEPVGDARAASGVPPPVPTAPSAPAGVAEPPDAPTTWRWQQALGWFLILSALSLALVLALWEQSTNDAPVQRPGASSVAPVPGLPGGAPPDGPVSADASPADTALSADVPARAPDGEASTDETPPASTARPMTAPPARGAPPSTSTDAGRRLGLPPQRGQAILPPRVAGLSPSDVDALASSAGVDPRRGGVTWVVLSTASEAEADALTARYRTSGYRTSVLDTGGSGRAHRVVVGQFATREQALRLRDRLPPQAPPDTWPLSLP